jgi:hypothetical protein
MVADGTSRIFFQGNFTHNGNDITGGTITGFQVFTQTNIHLLSATGYSIDALAMKNNIVSGGFNPWVKLPDLPLTMNGSEFSDDLRADFTSVAPLRLFGRAGRMRSLAVAPTTSCPAAPART